MIAKDNIRITITLPKETTEAFRTCCNDIGCTVSALILELVEGFIFEYNGGDEHANSD